MVGFKGSFVVIAALACVPALADDTGSWDGFYVGGAAGVARGDASWRYTNGNWATPKKQTIDGNLFGLVAGYQKQFDQFVLGAEATVTKSVGHIDGRATCPNLAWTCNVSDVDNLYTIGPKVGYAITSDWLVYLFGGYASGQVKTMSKSSVYVEPTSHRHDGWVAGVGVDYAISDNIRVGAKYSRVDLKSQTHTQNVFASDDRNIKPALDIFAIQLSYVFR